MWASRRIAGLPKAQALCSRPPAVLHGAISLPVAPFTARLLVTRLPAARKVHQSSRDRPSSRKPPALPIYRTGRTPDGNLAFWRSVGFVMAVTAAFLVVDFTLRQQRPLLQSKSSDEMSDDEKEAQTWAGFAENFEAWEAGAEEPFRSFFRDGHEAVARRDWVGVRAALTAAWRASEGREDRFQPFTPWFFKLLFMTYIIPDMCGSELYDFSAASQLAEEILPVIDRKRSLTERRKPGTQRESETWLTLLQLSLDIRSGIGWEIFRNGVQSDLFTVHPAPSNKESTIARMKQILQPPREQFVTLMEDIRARGNNPFGDVRHNRMIEAYCELNLIVALETEQFEDAIRFAQYPALIGNRDLLSPDQICDRFYRLGDAIMTYVSSTSKQNELDPIDSRIRPEFEEAKGVVEMAPRLLASGSKKELVVASVEMANQCIVWSGDIEQGILRDKTQFKVFLFAAHVCRAAGDSDQTGIFILRAENAARAVAKQTGDEQPLQSILTLKSEWGVIESITSSDDGPQTG